MRRALLAACAAALLALPGTAGAAPVCELVKDPAGDAALVNPASPLKAPTYDIRSLDVASGRKTVVVLLRLASTATGSDQAATLGVEWSASFKINDVQYRVARKVAPSGTVDTATAGGAAMKGVTVKVDKTSVRWTIPRGAVAGLKKKGAILTSFFANASGPMTAWDWAPDSGSAATATYKDLTASCLKPA